MLMLLPQRPAYQGVNRMDSAVAVMASIVAEEGGPIPIAALEVMERDHARQLITRLRLRL